MTPHTSATAQPLRVVQFVNTLAITDGGPARNSFEVNLALNELSGVVVRMFWMKGTLEGSVLDGEVRPAPLVGPARGRVRQLVKSVRSADVAIIHGFYLWWIPLVSILCTINRVPYVIMPHGVFTRFQRRYSVPKKRVFDALGGRRTLRGTAAVLVASPDERDELREFAPSVNIAITGVGTTPVIDPARGPRHHPARIISMSRIAPKKRIDVAIRAIAELAARNVDATLIVAGTGDPTIMTDLRALAEQLGVSDRIDFIGAIAGRRKYDVLVGSDVFLAPSEDENFGIAVAEGLAHGLPVVATRAVSAAAIVEGSNAGGLIDSPSPVDAAVLIAEMLDEPDFSGMRERASALASQHYGWPVVARRWETELRRAADRVSAQDAHALEAINL